MPEEDMASGGTEHKKVSPIIDRRHLLASIGMGTSIGLAGCSGGGSDGETTDSGESDGSDKMGGHLRVSTAGGHNTLNPVLHGTTQEYIATEWLYSNLTQVNSDLEIVGDLATDWEAQDGGETWIFDLNENAQFKNGNQVLAEDVKATIEATQNPDFASPAEGSFGPIDSLEVVNDTTVQFNLTEPYGDIPKKMAKVRARIVPKNIIDAGPGSEEFSSLENEDHGSGAFVLDEFSPGNRLVFTKNEDYWKEDDDGNALPYLDKVTQLVQPESSTRVNSMRDESADHYYRVGPDQWEQLNNMEGVTGERMPGGWFYPVIFRVDKEPFDDVRVRQAIKYAVDKEEILETAGRGIGTLGQHSPISPAHQFYTDLGHPFGKTAQVDEANELMEEAGYGDGVELDFDLHVSPEHGGPMGPMAVLFQEQMAEIGIEFEITRLPWSEYVNQNQDLELVVTSWGMRLVEDGILTLIQVSGGGANYSRWSNEEFDEAVRQAMVATDQEEKQEHYTRAQELSNQRAAHIIPFFMERLEAHQEYENGYEMEPTGFRFPAERIWLDGSAPTK